MSNPPLPPVSSIDPPLSSLSNSSILSTSSTSSSPSTRSFIQRHEGLRLRAYKCPRGYWTWGYGCRIMDPLTCEALDADVAFELTRPQAESLLTLALSRATREAISLFPQLHSYSPARQTALVSLSYQLGLGGLAAFKQLCKAVYLQNWNRAADELLFVNALRPDTPSAYATQCPDRAQETAQMLRGG